MDLSADLAFILQDAPGSVPVVCGVSHFGILREASKFFEHQPGGLEVSGKERSLLFDPSQLPAIQKGASLTAGGAPYRVLRPVQHRSDGTAIALLMPL